MMRFLSPSTALINVLPGGFFLLVTMLLIPENVIVPSLGVRLLTQHDILSTFFFIATSYVVGEILQLIAYVFIDKAIDIVFFKGMRPSAAIFLKKNGIIDEETRAKLYGRMGVKVNDEIFRRCPSLSLPRHDLFQMIYHTTHSIKKVRDANARYLFLRVMVMVFVLIAMVSFLAYTSLFVTIICVVIAILLFHRAAQAAKGLVRDSVFQFLNKDSK